MCLNRCSFLPLCLTKSVKGSNFVIWIFEGWKRKENTNNLEEKRSLAFRFFLIPTVCTSPANNNS